MRGATVALLLALVLGLFFAADQLEQAGSLAGRPFYDLRAIRAPKLSGALLSAFTWLLGSWPLGRLLVAKVKSDSEFALPRLFAGTAAVADMPPTFVPLETPSPAAMRQHEAWARSHDPDAFLRRDPAAQRGGFRFATVTDYARAYRHTGSPVSPIEVARAVLRAVNASEQLSPPMRIFIAVDAEAALAQAAASAERLQRGEALSLWDGVPVAIKDEFDARGFPTTGGLSFPAPVALTDATAVARLRALGAVIIGKTNMHELGLGVTGMNPHHGFARNPYNLAHITGGSSSGSAAAVGAGLVPVALGADGGGSVRIPAGLCGAFGLKPTFGRISDAGAFTIAWTVTHPGPIAASASDLALAYMAMAGRDERDHNTLLQPPPHLHGVNATARLDDLRVGVFAEWVEDSSEEMRAATKRLVQQLQERGAKVVSVRIPNLQTIYRAHQISIGGEMATSAFRRFSEEPHRFGHDVRTALAVCRSLSTVDYVASQRVRTYATRLLREVFASVDVLVTPNTGDAAARIPDDAWPGGVADTELLSSNMRYAPIPNFTGHPAVTVPAGYTAAGLPLAVQFIGRHWEEHTLLRLAFVAEELAPRARPAAFFDILAEVRRK